jgi:hypothetical protein
MSEPAKAFGLRRSGQHVLPKRSFGSRMGRTLTNTGSGLRSRESVGGQSGRGLRAPEAMARSNVGDFGPRRERVAVGFVEVSASGRGTERLASLGFRPQRGEPSCSSQRGFGLRGTGSASGFDRASALRERMDSRWQVTSVTSSDRAARWLDEAFGWKRAAQAYEMATSRDQRHEGSGAGDGVQPRGRSKALKGQTP